MSSENKGRLLRGVGRIFNQGSLTGVGEGQLLRQYASRGDEAAFEAIVTRHGPMVLSVCRRMLYDPCDVEDAFQATFLVMLRRAASMREADPLSPWLHGVAFRVAARIRANGARRRAKEPKGARPEVTEEHDSSAERNELREIIDEEIGRLPEKYRKPVVLCYLEGRTHEEAAIRLHCTAGSVRGRLDRAREQLRNRLVRRGLAPTTGLITATLGAETAPAAVPASLIAGTIATVGRAATARDVATAVPAMVRELADGLLRTMMLAKLKLAAAVVAAGAVIIAAGIVLTVTLPRSFARDEQEAHNRAGAQGGSTVKTPDRSKPSQSVSSIVLSVVDHRSGNPLAGATITVQVGRNDISRSTTDEAGHLSISIPDPSPAILSVRASRDGFATMTGFLRHPQWQPGDIPASYKLAMHPVETVTGVVCDEAGRPIDGVLVEPTTGMSAGGGEPDRDEFELPTPVKTDAQGRWRCDDIPAGIESRRISFRFAHPDYQPVNLPNGAALELIKKGVATILPRGLEIAGRVVDRAGKSIVGARVYRGADRFGMGMDIPHADTDPEGRFRFSHVPAGETVLTVQAAGHAPDLTKINVAAALGSVEFRLEPGRKIHGRVVNAKGDPVPGATLVADGWRGYRTLDWSKSTDLEGRFEWSDAPPDLVWIDVVCDGYLAIRRRELPPADDALTIMLIKRLKVRGTVVDAVTHHAIQPFTLVPGTERGGNWPTYWNRDLARPLSKGRYEIQFDQSSRDGSRLRIEAEGYMPAISRQIRDDEDEPVINFSLQKGSGVSGVVRLADGTPLSGADVVLVTPSQPAFITNGQPPNNDGNRVAKTGGDGRFVFPAQEPPYRIVVLHDRGFAEQASDPERASAAHALTIQPWGRIEGTLRIGARPAAGQSLSLAYEMRQGETPSAAPWWAGTTNSSATGEFSFERVMPGEVSISKDIQVRPMTTSHSHSVQVEITAGKTARVVIGGTGRPIIGKVTATGAIADQVDWSYSINWLMRKQPQVEPPAGLDVEAKQNWYKTWTQSPEGKAQRRARRWYAVKLEPDGSFRVDDVEPGVYDLIISVNERPLDPHTVGLGDNQLGRARRDVTVPEMPSGRSDEPLDLGAIPLEPAKKRAVVKAGDAGPAFQIKTVDGKPVSLAEYRGKYVLLDFWATWCGPCLAETPHLKAVFDAFGKDERFVMIGLSLDKAHDDPRQYAIKHGLAWIQGFLGEWADGKLPDAYGVRGIPSIWLIGPDGKVIAKDLRGQQIKTVVAEALGRP